MIWLSNHSTNYDRQRCPLPSMILHPRAVRIQSPWRHRKMSPTLSIICDIYDPLTKQPYTRDPRYIAQKAEKYLSSTGIADTSYWGPEMEFFIFDDARFDQNQHCGFYYIDSIEAAWSTGGEENPNLGYKPRYKEGYFPVPPHDSLQDLRSEIILTMIKTGIPIEVHHHEVATAGQA